MNKLTFEDNLEEYLDTIICGDCLKIMKEMPDNSIDLIVTSPPYNLKNSTGNGMKQCTTSGKWANAALQNGYSNYCDNIPMKNMLIGKENVLKKCFA
ncbi:MAG: hypothetical protein LBH98_07355 [Chitinispirillales bacterium]|jgi:modification methylase|nr:hypothetical protein [Chitinispirillales bacterium]